MNDGINLLHTNGVIFVIFISRMMNSWMNYNSGMFSGGWGEGHWRMVFGSY